MVLTKNRCLAYTDIPAQAHGPAEGGASTQGPAFGSTRSSPYVLFFSMHGCGHCAAALPAFIQAAKEASVHGVHMGIVSNTTEHGAEQIRHAGVSGFPTVIGYNMGEAVHFKDRRTADAFLKFALSLKHQ